VSDATEAARAGPHPAAAGVTTLDLAHPDYPRALRDLKDAPPRLYVRGRLPRAPAVAIVGARAATPYGLAIARRLAADLARLGVVVVSGLARGIDAAAHRGALEVQGVTIAVLPSGLDAITPAHHHELAAAIAGAGPATGSGTRGALVTEIAAGGPHHRGAFIERNRLIAALARVTVVVEAAESSGALSTAAAAARLGRIVLAVPGDVGRPTSRGCHGLLRSGARVCEDAHDVLAALDHDPAGPIGAARAPTSTRASGATSPAAPAKHDAATGVATPEARLLAALEDVPATLDLLATRSGLTIEAALAALVPLEWSGLAHVEPGPRWRRGAR
jgi:DNA processing protein